MSWSVLWKNGITAFKGKVTVKVQNVCECLSGQYLLNHRTFCYQTWYHKKCSITSQSVMQKNWFSVFNVKITARSSIIKIWLFLLYLLTCWSACNQTWFDSTALKARVSCWKIGLLHSGSRSQQRFKMSVNVCPDDVLSMCPIVSTQYLLNHSTIFYQTWYGYAAS